MDRLNVNYRERENFLGLIILGDNSGLSVMSTKLRQIMNTVIMQSIKATRYIFKHDIGIKGISGRLIGSQLTWRKLIAKAVLVSFSKIQLLLDKLAQTAQEKNTNNFVIYWHKC